MRTSLRPPTPPQRSRTVESRVAIRKHPVHPMLVVFPIAFLGVVAPADLLFLWSGLAFWAQLAAVLNGAGLAMGLVAAAVGTVDLVLIPVVRRHVSAWSHAIAAVMLLAVAAAGVWLRWPDPVAAVWPWGLLLSSVMLLLVGVAGWIGGSLSFHHGIGVAGHEGGEDRGPDAPPEA
ncbi:DUF2231 domain-containing protein [Luteimonas terricola]|uniref:DUF2231 domain-containing protein n=1 Tax=Luteimonas terricola TaxID=645597 RepID=A0ABQ2EJ04_9GAMM|nr:DUF2231 domain-containing protein [Luteimonas terricola]GGK13610.1 hypothetical protein GCM10011394_23630 [Luteimonas terricola]